MRRVLFLLSLVTTLSAQVVFPPPTNQIQVVTGDNQVTLPNTPFPSPLAVQVVSPGGIPVPGATVTFTLPAPLKGGVPGASFPGGNSVFTTTAITNSLGFASSPLMTASSPAGNFTAQVSSSGLTSAQFKLAARVIPRPGPAVVLPNWLAYSMVIGDSAPPSQTLTVLSEPVNSYAAAADVPWIKLTPRTYQLLDVAIDPTGLPFGHYEGMISVSRDSTARVRLDIFDKPTINSSSTNLQFTYSAGATTVPLQQTFFVGSAARLIPVEVSPVYTNPKTGNWLGVASRRGVTLPIALTAVVDPRGLEPGTYTGAIQILGEARNSLFMVNVTLVVTQYRPPAAPRIPVITSFANAASSLEGAVAPGQLIRLAGANLSCLAAPSVTVDGEAARILSAGDREISLVVPDGVFAAGKDRAAVRVGCGEAVSDPFTVPVAYAAPTLFAASDTQALGYNDDLTMNGAETPAKAGSVITLFGTGFGDLEDSGDFAAPVSVTVGGEPAQLLSASRVKDMPGVAQLKVRVPVWAPIGNAVPFEIMSGLEKAPVTRTIAVQ